MPKKYKTVKILIDEDFKWMLKKKAVEHKTNICELTRRIAENDAFDQYLKVHNETKKKRRNFF